MPPDDDTTQHIWQIRPGYYEPHLANNNYEWICKRCGWSMRAAREPDSRKKFVLMEMAERGKLTLPGASMDCGEYLIYKVMTS